MGLFDNIKCEHPLPETGYAVPEGHVFQTKSLDSLADDYTITADGRLVLHRVCHEEVPEEERPYYGTPRWDEPMGQWLVSIRSVPVGDEEVPLHGDIIFYGAFRVRGEGAASLGEEGPAERVWIEFKARFTEGRLSRIEVANVHDLPPPKRTEKVGGKEHPVTESGLGVDVLHPGDEAEVGRSDDPGDKTGSQRRKSSGP